MVVLKPFNDQVENAKAAYLEPKNFLKNSAVYFKVNTWQKKLLKAAYIH